MLNAIWDLFICCGYYPCTTQSIYSHNYIQINNWDLPVINIETNGSDLFKNIYLEFLENILIFGNLPFVWYSKYPNLPRKYGNCLRFSINKMTSRQFWHMPVIETCLSQPNISYICIWYFLNTIFPLNPLQKYFQSK